MPSAPSTSLVMLIWPASSSGVDDRLALYSGSVARSWKVCRDVESRRVAPGLHRLAQVDQHGGAKP